MAFNEFLKQNKFLLPVTLLIISGFAVMIYGVFRQPLPETAHILKKETVQETILATGTVASETSLSLSFRNAGILADVRVSTGSMVKKGQILAQLDQRNANVQLARAKASHISAKANYEKLVNGSSVEEIAVAEAAASIARVNLRNAKSKYDSVVAQQKVLVDNARRALLNSELRAIPDTGNNSTKTIAVSGTYTGAEEGRLDVRVYSTGSGGNFMVSGLDFDSKGIVFDTPIAIGTKGLFLTFSSTGTFNSNDRWTIAIPNTQAANYVANLNSYQSALQAQSEAIRSAASDIDSAEAALQKAEADLALKKASPRQEDITAAEARLAEAEAGFLDARNAYEDNIIYAPVGGVITSVGVKIGEQVSPQKEVLAILNRGLLHVESNISESSIIHLKPGQAVDMTLDAFGPDRRFTGQIISIDPAANAASGVINYKVTSTLPDDPAIRPGMSVNLTIVTGEKQDVLAVPNRLIRYRNGERVVSVIRGSTRVDVAVETGLVGDMMTEIVSGLSEGDRIAEPARN